MISRSNYAVQFRDHMTMPGLQRSPKQMKGIGQDPHLPHCARYWNPWSVAAGWHDVSVAMRKSPYMAKSRSSLVAS
jgi:hypothetical protein